MRSLVHVVLLALPLGLGGCDPDIGSSRAAVNGTVDSANEWSGVLGLRIDKPEGVASCTGVLIERNLLLTARHCVSSTRPALICGSSPLAAPVAGANVRGTTDVTVGGALPIVGLRVEVPSDGDDECGFDIAAVILADSVAGAASYPPRLDSAVSTGEMFTAVGYGTTGSGGLGTRRARLDVAVACVGGVDCAFAEIQDTEWMAEDGSFCTSDSGAPAFSADGRVIGVISKGVNPCMFPVLSSTYAWGAWIGSVGRMAAMEGGYASPAWAEEPGTSDAGAPPAADAGAPPADDAGVSPRDGGDGAPPGGDGGGGCSISAARANAGWLSSLLLLGLVAVRRRASA